MRRIARLRQAVLKWAFEGNLVNQDPSDESARVLLDRLPGGLPLVVYPAGEGRGLVRLAGTWRSGAKGPLR